jgi:hypothetical protein
MSVVRLLAALILSAAAAANAQAADAPLAKDPGHVKIVKNPGDGLSYAVPKASPLRVKKLDADGAHFAGSVRITGKYLYGYNDDYVSDSGETGEPDLYFVPDDGSRRLLPYWYERGPVTGLHFANANVFLAAALKPTTVAKVKARKIKSVTGTLTIWVDEYVATESCDAPVYTARFLRIETPPAVVARNGYADPISCG